MITQFFGNYLLNEHLVTPNQLIEALQEKNNTRLKLGVLAINAGYDCFRSREGTYGTD